MEEGVEIFYFPDESNLSALQRGSSPMCKDSKNSSEMDLSNMVDCNMDVPKVKDEQEVEIANEAVNVMAEPPISIVAKDLGDFNVPAHNRTDSVKVCRFSCLII